MPAINTLTINDGAVAPVAHTFSPVTTNGAKAEWADRSALAPAGNAVITHELVKPGTPQAAYRVKLGFNVPVMVTVDGVPTVVRNSSAQVIVNCSTNGSEQERKDILAYVKNALANASITDSVVKLEPFY